ncbi:MAG: hypothetical protein OXG56_09635 [Gammaproteobacteria bacterium]|nr:hypothetical protein [Gammaproteobacteria bacterium]
MPLAYPGHLLLHFSGDLDIEAAIRAYTALDTVQHAAPDLLPGDGPDVYVTRRDNRWFVTFREAWGDCPSGCIHSRFHRFVVEHNTLRKLANPGT